MSGFAMILVFVLAGAAAAYWLVRSKSPDEAKKGASEWMRQKQARKGIGSMPAPDDSRFGRPKGGARAGFGRR